LAAAAKSGRDIADTLNAMTQLPVSRVPLTNLQPADSPRLNGVDRQHVQVLAELPADRLPPILVRQRTLQIIDGMHRYEAAKLRGEDAITARLIDCTSENAYLLAIKSNILHGMPLSLADRTAVAERILASYPHWSDRTIAAISGLAGHTVGAIRRRSTEHSLHSNRRVGQDGRVRPTEGGEGRLRAAEVISARPDAPLREIAREAGISLGTAHEVRKRMRQGKDPVTPTQRMAEPAKRAPARDAAAHPAGNAPTSRPGFARWLPVRQKLSRDPTLKYSRAGHSMLRWLDVHVVGLDHWNEIVDTVPPHWRGIVGDMARSCSEQWAQFATELEQRQHKDRRLPPVKASEQAHGEALC